MLGYLEKFNKLPPAIKRRVSEARTMAVIEALEKKYKIALAALIMKIMVGELALNELAESLLKENLSKSEADELAKELKEKLFSLLGNYFSVGAAKLAPPLNGEAKVKGAGFFFSADDEEEIRRLTKKIAAAESSAPGDINDKLEEIISRARINFGSADLAARFSQILKIYLRGIRNKLNSKATLMKPFLSGGLSFDEDSAEKVMMLADKVLNSGSGQPLESPPKIRLPQSKKINPSPQHEISRDTAYDFSKLKAKDDKIKNDLKKLDTVHELAPLMPAVAPAAVKNAPKQEKIPSPPQKNSQAEAEPIRMPLIKRRFEAENSGQSQKVKLEDVKYVPRVMGPLDELKYLDLISFRRLAQDPFNGAAKIKDKINLLAEENYGKKLEGIKLWRLSPVNKLYLEIGHLSISENKPVDVIIEERKFDNRECLTTEEFKAIMDLNKSLRF